MKGTQKKPGVAICTCNQSTEEIGGRPETGEFLALASQSGSSEVSGRPGRAGGMAQQLKANTVLVECLVNSLPDHLLFPD